MADETLQWKMDVEQDDFIDRLKQGLKNKGISQSEFARTCGCSSSRINSLLNKKYFGFTPKYIYDTAKSIGVIN